MVSDPRGPGQYVVLGGERRYRGVHDVHPGIARGDYKLPLPVIITCETEEETARLERLQPFFDLAEEALNPEPDIVAGIALNLKTNDEAREICEEQDAVHTLDQGKWEADRYPSNGSVLSLLVSEALPYALSIYNMRVSIPNIILTNSGELRYDIFAGTFNEKHQLTALPLADAFLYVPNITMSVAEQVLLGLNKDGENDRRSLDLLERDARGDSDAKYTDSDVLSYSPILASAYDHSTLPASRAPSTFRTAVLAHV
ncbi:uncharacterized protein C8Q71DRAFT_854508 [Rhodofomes roseus]|uniref:Putative 5'-nucleotidase C-terminal domain-containing protein n=1 Tax=Rhodofomes roseus TaxID=34475 RepID=A0ABQ8KPU3_9APHY|nr:uncharacterized protein C8Q71DRAFT_854508 [Rhodofomes roseus]KAH9840631.1 hypothetical protein C8Q71DRAFT_854508 [Rhodofomes roseus]